jgi:Arc/MetJ family transcription regulator
MTLEHIYSGPMKRRTTIEIDDALLGKAREVLGTRGLRDTVEAALDQVVKAALREDLIRQFESGDGLDLGDEILAEIRRPPE